MLNPFSNDLGDAHPDNRANVRRTIDEGDQAGAQEQYHDEIDRPENANGRDSRLRLETSGLAVGDGVE
jgi:hypothetical protein